VNGYSEPRDASRSVIRLNCRGARYIRFCDLANERDFLVPSESRAVRLADYGN
jgi:hypothetical protein